MLFAFAVVATVFCVCCISSVYFVFCVICVIVCTDILNDILSILLYDCVKCPCLMKKVTFSSDGGGGVRFRFTSLRDFGRSYVRAFLRH